MLKKVFWKICQKPVHCAETSAADVPHVFFPHVIFSTVFLNCAAVALRVVAIVLSFFFLYMLGKSFWKICQSQSTVLDICDSVFF
jgi:hypothetical protein